MTATPRSFDYHPRTRIVFGADSVQQLGELVRELPCSRVLIVTDPGIVRAGHVERARASLTASGIESSVFDGVRENPTTLDVDACLEASREAGIDGIIGLGGGSAMDTAKGCNFLLTNGGRMQDYWGIGKATRTMLPLIAIPTTAGTGSECQSFALIADEVTHQKMACGDPKAAARIALLDPLLTLSQPASVTACTGIDALAHAVETSVTRRRSSISSMFSRESFRLLIQNLHRVLADPEDLQSRSNMLLGAALAGTAIENSMLGAAHSCANPLTAHFGTVHGQAVGQMLPHVVRFNGEDPEARALYHEWALFGGLVSGDMDPSAAVEAIAEAITSLLRKAALPLSPAADGASESDIPLLAREAAKQWTATFNPRPISVEDFEVLYARALAAS